MSQGINQDIGRRLDKIWGKYFEERWRCGNLNERILKRFSGDNNPMFIVHNTLRDQWENTKSQRITQWKRSHIDGCWFDGLERSRKCMPYGSLSFTFAWPATYRHHLLIFCKDHREEPSAEDHLCVMNFVKVTDYAVFLNLRGSGAGLPEHLHYQGHKRYRFPLLKAHYRTHQLATNAMFDVLSLEETDNYAVIFQYKSLRALEVVASILETAHLVLTNEGLSYNLLFDKGRVFLFPRVQEIAKKIPPYLENTGMTQWQIAGQEMGHLFTAKNRMIFQTVKKEDLQCAIKEVCLTDHRKRTIFQRQLQSIVKA